MVSELLKRSEDFHISALEGPMGNEKQLEKSWKDVLFLLRIEVQKGLALDTNLRNRCYQIQDLRKAQFSHE
jgi:hypothetical protein